MISITIDPAPRAALCALSPVIFLTTPATIICRPPPAELVDIYKSIPSVFSEEVLMNFSPSKIALSDNSSNSRIALITPRVTSSKGASTVVGASPLCVNLYSPSTFSISIDLVVVDPQSVAKIILISSSFFFILFNKISDIDII